jgi:hypothetical protein
VDKFCGGGRGVTPTLLLTVAETILFKIEAFAKGGIVQVNDRYKFIAEAFLKSSFGDADFEVGSGFVKVANQVKGARKKTLFRCWPETCSRISNCGPRDAGIPGIFTVGRVVIAFFGAYLTTILQACQDLTGSLDGTVFALRNYSRLFGESIRSTNDGDP